MGTEGAEISEEDVDPEQAAATHPKHLSLSSAQPESVQEDEAGAVPGQIGGRGTGVNKYKQKLVQKFVTQGPSKLKSDSSDNRSETGSEKQKRPKKGVALKKSLKKKLTKKCKPASSDSEEFHGFTDTEIETASLKSDRSLITKSNSKENKKSIQKKLKLVPKS